MTTGLTPGGPRRRARGSVMSGGARARVPIGGRASVPIGGASPNEPHTNERA